MYISHNNTFPLLETAAVQVEQETLLPLVRFSMKYSHTALRFSRDAICKLIL